MEFCLRLSDGSMNWMGERELRDMGFRLPMPEWSKKMGGFYGFEGEAASV